MDTKNRFVEVYPYCILALTHTAASWITGSWQNRVKIRIQEHPILKLENIERPFDGKCSMCSRKRKLSYRAVLTGKPYNIIKYSPNDWWEADFENCTVDESKCGMEDWKNDGICFYVGSNCADRIRNYHSCQHFKYKLLHHLATECNRSKWIKDDINKNYGKKLNNSKMLQGNYNN